MANKVIITCAITGSIHTPTMSPHLPVTAQEIADAAIGAAKLRVRPIIMTAFAFILGVMPLVFASGVYATARNIMGVALVGGMLFATLLGIFVYPALYYFVGRIGNFERRRERKKQEEKL